MGLIEAIAIVKDMGMKDFLLARVEAAAARSAERQANKPEFPNEGDASCPHKYFRTYHYKKGVRIGGVCSRCGKPVKLPPK